MMLALLFLHACTGDTGESTSYSGTFIQLDFSAAEEITDEAWIEIDGVRFTHYIDFVKAYEGDYSLPASRSVWMDMENFVDPHTIALTLATRLDMLAQSETHEIRSGNNVKASHDLLLYGQSTVRLSGEDGARFTVQTSPAYPVPIEILED